MPPASYGKGARVQLRKLPQGDGPRNSPDMSNRRDFWKATIYAIGVFVTGALGVPGLLYLFWPPTASRHSRWIDAGDAGHLEPQKPQERTFRRNRVDGSRVSSEKGTAWILKTAANKVIAFSPWCTHLGCAYHWEESEHRFICPCHGSVFSIDGEVVAGPAPRPLDRYEVKIEGNRVWLGSVRSSEEGL